MPTYDCFLSLKTMRTVTRLTTLSLMLSCALTACTTPSYHTANSAKPVISGTQVQSAPSLDVHQSVMMTINGKPMAVRVFSNVAYTTDPAKISQQMHIYIPESYFQDGVINGYTTKTAPIFFLSSTNTSAKPTAPTSIPKEILTALSYGHVAVNMTSTQSSSAQPDTTDALNELKAAIDYLEINDAKMAGRAERIIVSGTNSALLGATIGNDDNTSQKIDGNIFAIISHDTPIADSHINHLAYVWQNNHMNHAHDTIAQHSNKAFANHVNSLALQGHDGASLHLNADGDGTFKEEIIHYLNHAMNTAHRRGVDLHQLDFLAQIKAKNPYYVDDFAGFLRHITHNNQTAPQHDTDKLNDSHQPTSAIEHLTNSPVQYWWIRHHIEDNQTPLAAPVIFANHLKQQGKHVDFAFVWDAKSSHDDELTALFTWIDGIIKAAS